MAHASSIFPLFAPLPGNATAQAFETVTGTAGDDTWVFDTQGATGRITVSGGDGHDRLTLDYRSFGAAPELNADFDMMSGEITYYVSCGGGETVLQTQAGSDLEEVIFYAGNLGSRLGNNSLDFAMTLWGGHGADYFWGGTQGDMVRLAGGNDFAMTAHGNDTVLGGLGNDTVNAGMGDDFVFGGAGDDLLSAHDGADTLNGAAGNDTMTGGFGNDLLTGGAGNDDISDVDGANTISGGAGNDTVVSGAGTDLIRGGLGDDSIDAGAANDTLDGGAGADTLSGGDGDDALIGGQGDDSLAGDAGADTLRGASGNDTLAGGDGADVLIGGQGDDLLAGGAASDRFVHNGTVLAGTDVISDFVAADDFLVLDDPAGNAANFSVQSVDLAGVGAAGVLDTFVLNTLTGEMVWVLADVSALPSLMLEIGGSSFDLMI